MSASDLGIDSVRGGIRVLLPGFPVQGTEQFFPRHNTPQASPTVSAW